MVTINNKISLIIDVDNLFQINDDKVQSIINGDIYLVDILYKDSINIIKNNLHFNFINQVINEVKPLGEWMNSYNLKNEQDIVTFLRYATQALTLTSNDNLEHPDSVINS